MINPNLFDILKQIKETPTPYPTELLKARRAEYVAQIEQIKNQKPCRVPGFWNGHTTAANVVCHSDCTKFTAQ